MPTRNDILRIAGAEVGYTERGNNNTKYWAAIKPNWQGQPWCAAFTAWVYQRAGLDVLLKGPSLPFYTPNIEAWAKANKRWISVRHALPGDLVLYGNNRAVHVGLLVSQGGGFVKTIEGNTSSGMFGSQANGGGVYRRRRLVSWNAGIGKVRGCVSMAGFLTKPQATTSTAPAVPAKKPAVPAKKPVVTIAKKPRVWPLVVNGQRGTWPGRVEHIVGRPVDRRITVSDVSAIKNWQKRNGLKDDGEFGPKSWAKAVAVGQVK